MKKLSHKPHLIFFISIPVLILIGFINGNKMMNINVLDTYFVFDQIDLAILISILFAIIGFGYWIMQRSNRNLSKRLNFAHIFLTFGGILLIGILAQQFRDPGKDFAFNNYLTLAIYSIALIAILGQGVYLINILRAIRRKGD